MNVVSQTVPAKKSSTEVDSPLVPHKSSTESGDDSYQSKESEDESSQEESCAYRLYNDKVGMIICTQTTNQNSLCVEATTNAKKLKV